MSDLCVDPDQIGSRLGLDLPLSGPVRHRLEDAVLDAQGEVEAYLCRSLGATEHTLTGLTPMPPWPLDDPRAWPTAKARFDDRLRVVSHTPHVGEHGTVPGRYDVVFMVGLDIEGDPTLDPIVRFIARSAVMRLGDDPAFKEAPRRVSSVSADGQSVSYENSVRSVAEGAMGAPPNIKSLRRWRRLAIFQRPTRPAEPWPY